MIGLIKKYASSEGLNNDPFPDEYDSETGQMGAFYDRTVVGGHFALLLVPEVLGSTSRSSGGNAENDGRPTTGSPTIPVLLTVFAALTYVLF